MAESPAETPTEERPTAPVKGALFDLLVSGDRQPRSVHTAVREIESMAGQSVVTETRAEIRTVAQEHRAEMQTMAQELRAEMRMMAQVLRTEIQPVDSRLTAHIETTNARFDAVQRQLTLIWTFLILLLGTFRGALTTVLPRG